MVKPDPVVKPDLIVQSLQVSKSTLVPGELFTLSATVKNNGDGQAPSTTLRYYRSTDNNISTSDTEVGSDSVSALSANRTSQESVNLTAPTSPGTYYYGACVDSLTDESDTDNNCSHAVSVIVQPPVPQKSDLVVEMVQALPSTVEPGEAFRLYATLKNNGTGESTATILRYYRSSNDIISTQDTQLASANRDPLTANATLRRYLTVTAPTTPGTYYYGVCVDSITDENDTDNNCSIAVSVTVTAPPMVAKDVNLEVESAPSHPFIYWTDRGTDKIQRANFDGSNVQDLVTTGLSNPEHIAVDIAGGKMYWTEFSTIKCANLEGSNVQDLVTRLDSASGIALDVASGKMYWTVWNDDKIQRANLDGSNVETLVTQSARGPTDIALDVAGGKMYWTLQDRTNQGRKNIYRANLDGSNIQNLAGRSSGSWPAGIALDVVGGKMYWTVTGKIRRANLDGSNIEDLVTGLATGTTAIDIDIALDVAGGKMYWTNPYTDKIQCANLDGSNVEDLVTGLESPSGIAIVSSSLVNPTTIKEVEILSYDINGDGTVDGKDADALIFAVVDGLTNPKYDVNGDGKVDVLDIKAVNANRDAGAAGAPTRFGMQLSAVQRDRIQAQIDLLIATDDRSPAAMRTLIYLQQLIAMETRPEKTQLLANYPNPFNPETWIPYDVAEPGDVSITIYAVNGQVVRRLDLGHQAAGMYQSRSRAAYWDGRNAFGEPVASGLYFYTLTAGDFTATRKMLIRK